MVACVLQGVPHLGPSHAWTPPGSQQTAACARAFLRPPAAGATCSPAATARQQRPAGAMAAAPTTAPAPAQTATPASSARSERSESHTTSLTPHVKLGSAGGPYTHVSSQVKRVTQAGACHWLGVQQRHGIQGPMRRRCLLPHCRHRPCWSALDIGRSSHYCFYGGVLSASDRDHIRLELP